MRNQRLTYSLLTLLIVIFALFFSLMALQQHRAFLTNGLDLGNVDQALWNSAQGRFLHFTLMWPVDSRLALHVEPILGLFIPFYWLGVGGPEFLLISQAVIVAFGAWPLYELTRLPSRKTSPLSLIIPLAYLLYPPLESAVLFDFHAVTLAPTFILLALWSWAQGWTRRFLFFILLTLACKEDMPLLIATLSLTLAWRTPTRWRLAALTFSLSLLWFALAFFVIQPHYAVGGNIQMDRYAWLGDDPLAILHTIATDPMLVINHIWVEVDIVTYLFNLSFPVAFLNWLTPITMVPILPTLAINMLSSNPFTWRLEDFHYAAPLAPFIFLAAHHTMTKINDRIAAISSDAPMVRKATTLAPLIILLICTLMYHAHRGYTPLSRAFQWPEVMPHHQRIAAFIESLPPDVPLFAQSNLAPHVSQRPYLYGDFGYFTDPDFNAPAPAQGVLLDLTTLANEGGLHHYLHEKLLHDYTLHQADNGLLYFSLMPPPQPPPPITINLPLPNPSYPLTIDFGDMIRLHRYHLQFNRQEEVQVTLEFEPRQPLPPDLQPILYLLDETGQPLGATTDIQPMLVWYPPDKWPINQMLTVHFNTLPWYTREMTAYRLALGFIRGGDVWHMEQRLRPTLAETSPLAPRLAADGTLIELARIEQRWAMPHGGPTTRQVEPPTISHQQASNFDERILLMGYDDPIIKEETLTITLYWQGLVDNLPPLTRFVQLVGPGPQVYGQHDGLPDHYPTSWWQGGEIIAETVTFPLDPNRPLGEYTLHVGFYQPENGARLTRLEGGDHAEIALPSK